MTGCSGLCGSSVKARIGTELFAPECKCCQPKNVQEHNVSMTCPNGPKIYTVFHEILECNCEPTSCQSSYNMDHVNVVPPSMSKRALSETIQKMREMDPIETKRQVRSLLQDLAIMNRVNIDKKKRKKRK